MRLMSRLAREKERADHNRQQAEAHHQRTGEWQLAGLAQRSVHHHLAAHQRRTARRSAAARRARPKPAWGLRRARRAASCAAAPARPWCRSRPAETRMRVDMTVGSRLALTASRWVHSREPTAWAQDALGREIQQDGAEQRLRDAHAAQDEILPGRFQGGGRAVERDQQHRGQRGRFHRHPHDAQVVSREHQQHGEAEHLVHAVVQAQARQSKPARGRARCACRGAKTATW